YLFDRATGKVIEEIKAPNEVTAIAFHPNGHRLATGGVDGSIQVWEAIAQQEQGPLAQVGTKGHKVIKQLQDRLQGPGDLPRIVALAYTRGGQQLLSASSQFSSDGEIKLWDVEAGTELLSLPGQLGAALSGDGRRLASGDPDSGGRAVLRIWDLEG